jgi:hypothetical protein
MRDQHITVGTDIISWQTDVLAGTIDVREKDGLIDIQIIGSRFTYYVDLKVPGSLTQMDLMLLNIAYAQELGHLDPPQRRHDVPVKCKSEA